jgi:transcriptional regulator with XRE-family HTH domain
MSGLQVHRPFKSKSMPQKQGGVALLPCIPITLKASKTRNAAFVPRHLGDHLRRRRLVRKLTKEAAAKEIGVSLRAFGYLEAGESEPLIQNYPAILRFLGYDPYPPPLTTLPERMLAKRRAMGWGQKEAARAYGVNERTWMKWERGQGLPSDRFGHREPLERFLKAASQP